MSESDARRARWRADLHEYGGAAARAAGLTRLADDSDVAAATNRDYADLMVELAAAKAGTDIAVIKEVKTRVVAFRAAWRGDVDQPRVGIINNFTEPTDAELIGLGY